MIMKVQAFQTTNRKVFFYEKDALREERKILQDYLADISYKIRNLSPGDVVDGRYSGLKNEFDDVCMRLIKVLGRIAILEGEATEDEIPF